MNDRKCSMCSEVKPESSFRKKKYKGRLVLNSSCVECERKRNKAYYERNKEGMKRQARSYYYDNKAKVLSNVEKYRNKNRLLIQEKGREYYRRKLCSRMLNGSRARAKRFGIDHGISESDIHVPEICPLLGIPLQVSDGKVSDNSPSLDRIDPSKGYIPGNVWVISHKANTIKSDATLEELEKLTRNLKNFLSTPQETILTSDEIPF